MTAAKESDSANTDVKKMIDVRGNKKGDGESCGSVEQQKLRSLVQNAATHGLIIRS